MIEQEALDFTKTFESYDDFRSQEKSVLLSKYSALIGTSVDTDFESIYKDTYDFVMQTIYNYYDGYYLTSATKDRFLTLLGTIVSGKLPSYKVRYDNYLNARNLVYDNLSSRESTSVTSGTESGSGKQNYKNTKSGTKTESGNSKYADTPENINSTTDFIDQYTTGQSKDSSSSSTSGESNTSTDYSNSRNKSGNKKYTDTLKGGAKQVWENVESIPSEIYKEVITITAKLFFSESLEERVYPMTYITLTNKVKELEKKVVTGLEQELLDNYDLVTTITTDYQNFVATTSLKVFYDIATEYYEENKGRIDILTGRMDTAESNIESLKVRTTKNEQDIATNKTNIAKNTTDIATNKTNIAKNTADIATNKTNIAKNTTDIATNKTNIAKNATDISALQTRMNTAETDINSLETRVGKTETDISNINADITTIETTLNASVKEVSHQYDTSTRALKINYTLNNGSVKTSTLYLPLATLTSAGLMSADQFSKLDQVVLYGTNYVTSGRNFAVQKDEDNDLYVYVPESGSYTLPIASKNTLGGIKVGNNLTIASDGTLNAQGGSSYTLPVATKTTLGGVKQGEGCEIASDGTLKVTPEAIGLIPVVKMYENEGLCCKYTSGKVTLSATTPQTFVISNINSLELQLDDNYKYFKRSVYGSDKQTIYLNYSSYEKNYYYYYPSDVTDLVFTEKEFKMTIIGGSLTLKQSSSSYPSCDLEIYMNFETNSGYLKFTTTDTNNYSFFCSMFSAQPTASGNITIRYVDTYSAYTGYFVLDGKAYLL